MVNIQKIYIKDEVRLPIDTLYTFLKRILHLDGNSYDIRGTTKDTYNDIECTHLQCPNHKRRSFQDLVLISKTYFKVSDKNVAKVIKRFLDDDTLGTVLVLCDTAKKWVFYCNLTKSNHIKYCAIYNSSYKKIDQVGDNDVYSFTNIIKLMGLTIQDLKIENG